jgi:hypothetical protein
MPGETIAPELLTISAARNGPPSPSGTVLDAELEFIVRVN